MNSTYPGELADRTATARGGQPGRALRAVPVLVPIQPSCIS